MNITNSNGKRFGLFQYRGFIAVSNRFRRFRTTNLKTVFLRFPEEARLASLSTQGTMFASAIRDSKSWLKRWVLSPAVAIADSGDSPPMPMGGFNSASRRSGSGGGGGGCFIATAAYGSPMERHVKTLRDFRDSYLLNSSIGRIFVATYYRYSPPIADFIAEHDMIRAFVRFGLLPLVGLSYSTLHFGGAFTVAGLLFILVLQLCLISAYRTRKT
ncbi:CFI-box-CTERM domain-containing protein [Thermodesulfobacteriota bacterium]